MWSWTSRTRDHKIEYVVTSSSSLSIFYDNNNDFTLFESQTKTRSSLYTLQYGCISISNIPVGAICNFTSIIGNAFSYSVKGEYHNCNEYGCCRMCASTKSMQVFLVLKIYFFCCCWLCPSFSRQQFCFAFAFCFSFGITLNTMQSRDQVDIQMKEDICLH